MKVAVIEAREAGGGGAEPNQTMVKVDFITFAADEVGANTLPVRAPRALQGEPGFSLFVLRLALEARAHTQGDEYGWRRGRAQGRVRQGPCA